VNSDGRQKGGSRRMPGSPRASGGGGGASRGAGSREGTRDGRGSVPASRKDRRESGSSRGGRLQDADKVRQPGGDGRGDVRYRRRTTSGDSGGDSNEGRNIERSYGVSSSRSSSSGGGGNAPDLWGLPNQALLAALDRSRLARQQLAEDREEEEEEEEEEAQPDAWAYIHYVSHFYALHLQVCRTMYDIMRLMKATCGHSVLVVSLCYIYPPIYKSSKGSIDRSKGCQTTGHLARKLPVDRYPNQDTYYRPF
ncbi:hypothetical protein Vretimale_14467, partial [Volvox reticuliferus]